MKKIIIYHPNRWILRSCILILLSLYYTPSSEVTAQCTPTEQTIHGVVFDDANSNGNFDSESGVEGIYVNIYNESGALAGSTFSDSDGNYAVDGLTDGEKYKVVFSNGTSLVDTKIGNDNQSAVQFVSAPACNVSYGLKKKAESCGDSPDVALTCFVHGPVTTNADMPTIVGTNYAFNEGSAKKMYASHGHTGSIWGMAWKNTTQEIFTSAFVKQFSGLKSGPYAIFTTDVNEDRNASLYIDLKDSGIITKSLSSNNIDDCAYGSSVGRIGLGGMDISEDESTLYVAVLDGNQIVAVPSEGTAANNVTIYDVPAPVDLPDGEEYRVFAVEMHDEELYIGVTITGAVAKKSSSSAAVVMKLDVRTSSFTEVFRTSYIKGYWQDEDTDSYATSHWLTDIGFTDDNNLILSLTDRIGHKYCKSEGNGRVDQQYPDILMAGYDESTDSWTLESNGRVGDLIGSGVGNGQGPGNGEFFGFDYFPGNPEYHKEVALGSITVLPGTNSVVATVYDPLLNTYSGGLHRYSTIDGSLLGAIEFYTDNVNVAFGKASGFGDVISLCGPNNIEIGNYVWIDEDEDGIQDANESPVVGISVNLYNENCQLVESTVTDASGRYLLNTSVLSGADYFIAVGEESYNQDSGLYSINGTEGYSLTQANSSTVGDDSNSSLEVNCLSTPVIPVNAEDNDYSYDIGFRISTDFDLALTKELLGSPFVSEGDLIGFEIKLYNQGAVAATNIEVIDYVPGGLKFLTSDNEGWEIRDGKVVTTVTETLLPGKTHSIIIKLRVQRSSYDQYTNYAEIIGAQDTNGNDREDIDSVADDTSDNDNGGIADSDTDDELNGDGTIDEDDHDPAIVKIFDLALKIELEDEKIYYAGQDVEFLITVYNQGVVDAGSISLINYVPNGLIFSQDNNPDWRFGGGSIRMTDNEVLKAGLSRTYKVYFTVDKFYNQESLVNYAEISSSIPVGSTESIDFDSTPDEIDDNDNGGVALSPQDNLVLGDTSEDEDDHDPVLVRTGYYDLALMKTVDRRNVKGGSDISFTIKVTNQGTGPVDKIEIIDYIPEGLTLNDTNWEMYSSDKATKTVFLDTPLQQDGSIEVKIDFVVDEGADAKRIINVAEILSFGLGDDDYTHLDIDSDADDVKENDNGGAVGTETDDIISLDPSIDEDDQDPAVVYRVITLSDVQCLSNATTTTDGQFADTFTFIGESQVEWHIDNFSNYYEMTSAAPPATPTPLTNTGEGGVTMDETYLGLGLSRYTFEAKRVDGEDAFIRFRSEFDDIEEFEMSGTYDDLQVEGNRGICNGGVEEYVITNANIGETYTWSLPDEGAFIGSDQGTSVLIDWNGVTPDSMFTIDVESDGCTAPLSFEVSNSASGSALLCDGHTNISLDANCEKVVTPHTVYAGSEDPSNFIVMLTDENGEVIPNATLTSEHIGQQIEVKIIDGCGTNNCWGIITVEDKISPVILCDDVLELSCKQLEEYEGPFASDNCDSPIVEMLTDEIIERYSCNDDYSMTIRRRYIATDSYGNQSEPCEVTINLLRLDLGEILPPEDYTMVDGNPLSCGDFLKDENGNPALSETLSPTYLGEQILPDFNGADCNVSVTYFDTEVSNFNGVRKIDRSFVIGEAHCSPDSYRIIVQRIDIVDNIAPVITCPEDIVVTADALNCMANLELPLPTATDECTDNITFKISNDFFTLIEDGDDRNVSLPFSESPYVITYEAKDERGNTSECTINVTVIDATPPIVICDSYTVVGLNDQGDGYLTAMGIDDGTFDYCGLDRLEIRRMTANEGCDDDGDEFADRIKFCCSDVGEEIMVVLGAWDRAGNFNQCMVSVTVQDKTPPKLIVPEPVTIECGDEYLPLSQFGIAEAIDSCNTTLTVDSTFMINDCGVGTITRTFTASDGSNSVTGEQIITIENTTPFDNSTIQWPTNLDTLGQCDASLLQPDNLPAEHAYPSFSQNRPCDNVAYTWSDEVYTYNLDLLDNCYTIIRTWTVRDWCQMDNPNYVPAVYEQMIKVRNQEEPEVTFAAIGEIETLDCDGAVVNFNAQGNDDCTPAEGLQYTLEIDIDNDGTNDQTYTGLGATINRNITLPLGTHSVLYTFTDACGNDGTRRDEFTVKYVKAPIASCLNMVVAISPMDLDGDGILETESACIFADSLGSKSEASCGVDFYLSFSPTERIEKDTVTCDDLGFITRTIYAVDIFGNYSECVVMIEVQDNNDVDICVDIEECVECPDSIDRSADNNCQYVVTPADGSDATYASDECGDLTFSHNYTGYGNGAYVWNDSTTLVGAAFPLGTTDIVWTVRDGNSRTTTCNQTITVSDDSAPVITCVDDIDVNVNMLADCAYENNDDLDAEAIDNCNLASLTHDYTGYPGYDYNDNSTLNGALFPVGTTTVLWTAVDGEGATSTCSTVITVTDDEAPVITCVMDSDLLNNSTDPGVCFYTNNEPLVPSASDLCGGEVTLVHDYTGFDGNPWGNLTTLDGAQFPVGSTTVTWTGTDLSGNTETCSIVINITDDTAPVLDCDLAQTSFNVSDDGVSDCFYEADDALDVSATDNCDDNNIVITHDYTGFDGNPWNDPSTLEGALFETGETTITWTATDGDNSSTCEVVITVLDDVDPMIACINGDIIRGDNEDGDSDCRYTVSDDALDADGNDLCSDVIVYHNVRPAVDTTTLEGLSFDVGNHIIEWTAEDASGNSVICEINLIVTDDGLPTVTCVDDVSFGTGDDNILDDCTYTVLDDSLDAIPNDLCSSNDQVLIYHDVRPAADTTTLQGLEFPVGTTTVTWTAVDGSGNVGECSFNITVEDNQLPTIDECLNNNGDDIVLPVDSDCQVILGTGYDISANDNCGLDGLTIEHDVDGLMSSSSLAGAVVEVGETLTVTWTVTDGAGNSAEPVCIATFVAEDNTAPVCAANDELEVTIPAGGELVIDSTFLVNLATDNCSDLTYDFTNNVFDCDDLGSHTVEYTITDASNNSTVCELMINIVEPPFSFECNDVTIYLDEDGVAVIDTSEIVSVSTGCTDAIITLSKSQFICNDYATENPRTVTVSVDVSGIIETCTSEVTVIDTFPPVVECPQSDVLDLTCSDFHTLYNGDLDEYVDFIANNDTGFTVEDNCFTQNSIYYEETYEVLISSVNSCGYGDFELQYKVLDTLSGLSDSCSIIVSIINDNLLTQDYVDNLFDGFETVTIAECLSNGSLGPNDLTGNITLDDFAGFEPCSNIAILDPVDSGLGDDMCDAEFTRDWTVIDSCQLSNLDPLAGVFTFQQTIMVIDTFAPVISVNLDTSFVSNNDCSLTFDLDAYVTVDDCNDYTIETINLNSTTPESDSLYIGNNEIVYIVTDVCGNEARDTISIPVLFEDEIPFCDKIFVDRPNDGVGDVIVKAKDHFSWIDSSCVVLEDFTFSFSNEDINDTIMTVDCSLSLPDTSYFSFIYFQGELIDSCKTLLTVEDPDNVCGDGFVAVGGIVATEEGRTIPNFNTTLKGSEFGSINTEENGEYLYEDVAVDRAYRVHASNDDFHANGVNVIDLIKVQRHILGIEILDSPYKLIAADVDNDTQITASDLLEIRKVILRINDKFSNNTSWRGINKDLVFMNEANPWYQPFEDDFIIDNLTKNVTADFVGVKIGDVNNSNNLVASEIPNSTRNSIFLSIDDKVLSRNNTVEMDFVASEEMQIYGIQLGIKAYDLDLSNIESEYFDIDNAILNKVSDGEYTLLLSDIDVVTIPKGGNVFTIEGKANREQVQLSETVSVSDRYINNAVFFNLDESNEEIALRFIKADGDLAFTIEQNRPNPWVNSTNVGMYLPSSGNVNYVVRSTTGKVVYSNSVYYNSGNQELTFDDQMLPIAGVYYLEVTHNDNSKTIKMIKLK